MLKKDSARLFAVGVGEKGTIEEKKMMKELLDLALIVASKCYYLLFVFLCRFWLLLFSSTKRHLKYIFFNLLPTFIVFLGIFFKNIFTIFTSLGNPQLVPNASTTSQLDHWTKCFLNWTPSILVLIFLIILYSKTTPFQDNLTFSFTISWWL